MIPASVIALIIMMHRKPYDNILTGMWLKRGQWLEFRFAKLECCPRPFCIIRSMVWNGVDLMILALHVDETDGCFLVLTQTKQMARYFDAISTTSSVEPTRNNSNIVL